MIHVFVGPTLPWPDPALTAPGVRVHPPIRHGDLFDAAVHAADTVVIIDGVYHHAPALRHKEILSVMGRGVRVIGAASIGALRAAELAEFGMLGVGSVYVAYARGEIDGDDEVAVGQVPDGAQESLTWPVVTLRHVVQLARSAGLLDEERATGLLAALRAVYYPQRTTAAVRAICCRLGEMEFAEWLAERREHDPHFGDVKRADALTAIRAALDGAVPLVPNVSRASVWQSPYFRRWSNARVRTPVDGFELSTEDRLTYQQVFDPHYRDRWASFLEYRSRHPADGGPGRPLSERLAEATGGALSPHQVFHPVLDLRDEATVTRLLAGESTQDRLQVARCADMIAAYRRSRPGFTVAAVRDGLARRLLRQAWHCPDEELDAEAAARGLVREARAVEAVKRFVPGLMDDRSEPAENRMTMNERREVAQGGR
ncbi:TfuA-like protein [Streptomyces hirsutus]|uniref:TfuA-like protein n=1 Tax=Streptomyces hirsutus TaxID=35620 RepID=UPI0033EEF29A